MKKLFSIIFLTFLMVSCVYANENIKINNVEFELPYKYCGGELKDNSYKINNIFSIRCIDSNVAEAIGLWALESETSQDLNINNHPVRHFCQYNKYVNGNYSHAYFMTGDSVYEIVWVGNEINSDIEKLINNTPQSNIDDDSFYKSLDACLDIYKQQKKEKLDSESEYNYLEAKYNGQSSQKSQDDTRFKEILLTYYINR